MAYILYYIYNSLFYDKKKYYNIIKRVNIIIFHMQTDRNIYYLKTRNKNSYAPIIYNLL